MEVETYLRRLGYGERCEPTLATLRSLHRAHLYAVPFENLDVHHSKQAISLDIETLFDKVVRQRRGGFCYELNGLFAALLEAVGFDVTLLSARVRCQDGGFGPEFDHLVLLVRLEQPWLADVGFGESFREPLHLVADEVQKQPYGTYRLRRDGDDWRYEVLTDDDSWRTEYYFSTIPRRLDEFAAMCHYHQTSPESPFTQKRLCTLATPTGRITLSDDRLIITEGSTVTERELTSAEFTATLDELFGIRVW
jgi:N-hydroxyarylamine O-acetyltransferase